MAVVDSYESMKGTVEGNLTFHFDIANDVLYLRRAATQDLEVFGEETSDGFILFRTEDEKIAGMTILDYWKRFGFGTINDVTLQGLQTVIEERATLLQQPLAA